MLVLCFWPIDLDTLTQDYPVELISITHNILLGRKDNHNLEVKKLNFVVSFNFMNEDMQSGQLYYIYPENVQLNLTVMQS